MAADVDAASGSAILWRAEMLSTRDEQQLIEQLQQARAEEYRALIIQTEQARTGTDADQPRALGRLRRELRRIRRRDYFPPPGAGNGPPRRRGPRRPGRSAGLNEPDGWSGVRWVTRAGVHIDRARSAWLIRRFIDPAATFGFVTDTADVPAGSSPRPRSEPFHTKVNGLDMWPCRSGSRDGR